MCPLISAKGQWIEGDSLQFEREYTWTQEYSRTEESSFSVTSAWQTSVTASVSVGFKFGEASLEVSGTKSKEMSSTISDAFTSTNGTEMKQTFPPGQMWQFEYDMVDSCSPHWTMRTRQVVHTDNLTDKPCCLPGSALDRDRQHGPCVAGTPCDCEPEICNDTGARKLSNLRH